MDYQSLNTLQGLGTGLLFGSITSLASCLCSHRATLATVEEAQFGADCHDSKGIVPIIGGSASIASLQL
ncbi:hypothetical protein IG631_19302 [Alternaria alternata]|nr:hypothetical protein IG631_19302 [Alternaria alternata]